MSDIEPAAKPQLGPLAACNRVAPLAPVKRNVRQAVRHFDPLDGRPARVEGISSGVEGCQVCGREADRDAAGGGL